MNLQNSSYGAFRNVWVKTSHKTWSWIPCNVRDGTDRAREDAVLSQKTVGVSLVCGKEKLQEKTSLGPAKGMGRSLVPEGRHKHKQFGN